MSMKICFVVLKLDFFISHRLDLAKSLGNTHQIHLITNTNEASIAEITTIKDLGISIYHLEGRSGSLNIFSYLRYAYSLHRIIANIAPNFVYYVTLEISTIGALLNNFMNIDKAFFLITGLEPFFFNPKLKFVFQRAIQKIFFLILRIKNNYLFIFQNSDDLEIFVAKKIVARTQVALIRGNGINTEYFSYRHRDISSKFIFLFASRLTRAKGILEFTEASKILSSQYPDVDFHIAGKYDHEDADTISKQDFKQIQTSNFVTYLGNLSSNELKNCFYNSSVFVLPSHGEGLPKVALEAASSGMPVIVADARGSRDCVINGQNGFYTKIGDPQELSTVMEKFILQKNLVNIFGKNSSELITKNFSLELISKEYLNAISNLKEQ